MKTMIYALALLMGTLSQTVTAAEGNFSVSPVTVQQGGIALVQWTNNAATLPTTGDIGFYIAEMNGPVICPVLPCYVLVAADLTNLVRINPCTNVNIGTSGSYAWQVPCKIEPGVYTLSVFQFDPQSGAVTNSGQSTFTVNAAPTPTIRLRSPNRGKWRAGTHHNVKLKTTGLVDGTVTVSLEPVCSGGLPITGDTVTIGKDGRCSIGFDIPLNSSPGDYRLVLTGSTQGGCNSARIESNGIFALKALK